MKPRHNGITLLELIVTMSISLLVAGLAMVAWAGANTVVNNFGRQQITREAIDGMLEQLGRDIRAARSAKRVAEQGRQSLVLQGDGSAPIVWQFVPDPDGAPTGGRLVRTVRSGGEAETIERPMPFVERVRFDVGEPTSGRAGGVTVFWRRTANVAPHGDAAPQGVDMHCCFWLRAAGPTADAP